MENYIKNPLIPYIGPIYGERLNPGQVVRIQGTVFNTAFRFDIDLQCGSQILPRDDIAIQVSFRFLDEYVSVNSLQNGVWGEEQKGALPIKRADKFEIIVVCEFNQYKVAVNGQYYCTFPQRIHYDRISHLVIEGDVSIAQISYTASPFGDGFCDSSATLQSNESENIHPPSAPNSDFSLPSYEAAVKNARPCPADPFSISPERQNVPYPVTGSLHKNVRPYPEDPFSRSPERQNLPYPITGSPHKNVRPYPEDPFSRSPERQNVPYPITGSPHNNARPYPEDPFSRSPERQNAPYPIIGSPHSHSASLRPYPPAANPSAASVGFGPRSIGFTPFVEKVVTKEGAASPPYPLTNPHPRNSTPSPPYPLTNPHPRTSTPPYPQLINSPYSAPTTIPLHVDNSSASSTVPLNADGSHFRRVRHKGAVPILIVVAILLVGFIIFCVIIT